MVLRTFLAAPALLALVPAAHAECPVSGLEEIQKAIDAAPDCAASAAVYGIWTTVASGDVQLAAVAIEKCEGEFLTGLSAAQRKARCERKYARQSGTMYRSFEASCAVNLARETSRKMAKARK